MPDAVQPTPCMSSPHFLCSPHSFLVQVFIPLSASDVSCPSTAHWGMWIAPNWRRWFMNTGRLDMSACPANGLTASGLYAGEGGSLDSS